MLLNVNRCYLHPEYYIFDLTLSQTGYIHIVFLGIIRQYEILKLNFNFDPLLISQVWPDVMRECHCGLIWLQDDTGSLGVQMKCTKYQDKSGEGRERLDGLKPVIVQIKEKHLRFCGLKNAVSKLLYL